MIVVLILAMALLVGTALACDLFFPPVWEIESIHRTDKIVLCISLWVLAVLTFPILIPIGLNTIKGAEFRMFLKDRLTADFNKLNEDN